MLKRLLDRRLGPVGLLVVVLCGAAATYGLARVVPKNDDPVATATPSATPCHPVADPFGDPPDTFEYATVPEAMRRRTVTALKLDEADGKVQMRQAVRGGLTLGQLVAVPGKDPADYAASLVASAAQGGADVTHGKGFAIIPLQSGEKVAVGVRGCDTILISTQDPNAVQVLAAAVFR